MNNFKKTVTIFSVCILIFSGMQNFISFTSTPTISLNTFQIKGFSVVVVSFLIYLCAILTGRKKMKIPSIVATIIGYFYTFYSLYKVYSQIEDSSFIVLSIGFYLYILSFVTFIISIFVKEEKKNKESISDSTINNSVIDNNEISIPYTDKYIIGNYILGLKQPGFYNLSCALSIQQNTKDLQLIIASGNEPFKLIIKEPQLKQIVVKQDITIQNTRKKPEDYKAEAMILSIALAGDVWGPMLANTLNTSVTETETKFISSYTVEIYYIENNEEKRLILEFSENPDIFFESYSNIYTKKS